MPDGTTSYEVNVNVIRAAFVYRDVGAAAAIAQRVVAAESGGGQWQVPALATLAFLRYISSEVDAAREAAAAAVSNRDAPRRPHGVIHALATTSLLELDQGDAEKAGRTARRALDIAAAVGLDMSVTAGLAHVGLGRAQVALGQPQDGVGELEIATGAARGARSDRPAHLRAAGAGRGAAVGRRPGRSAQVG